MIIYRYNADLTKDGWAVRDSYSNGKIVASYGFPLLKVWPIVQIPFYRAKVKAWYLNNFHGHFGD